METLQNYMSAKGIRTFPAAGHEVTTHCFFLCSGKPPKGKGKLYLNTESWLFDCKVCGTQGGRHRLLEHFGDEDTETWIPGANPTTRMALLSDYADMAAKMLEVNDAKVIWLLRRGLSPQTILDAKLGYVPKGYSICASLDGYSRKDFETAGMISHGSEFHGGRVTIPYLQRDRVIQIRGKDIEGRYYTPPGEAVRLYNADSLCDAETVLLVEGEFDCLIAAQALNSDGERIAVVGLPGAGAWPGGKDNFPDYFRAAKRVYLGLDPDEVGDRETDKLREALGTKARVVQLPRDESVVDTAGRTVKCDWTEYLRPADEDHPWGGHHRDDVMDLISVAESAGRRVFAVGDVHKRWRRSRTETPGLNLGWPSLDAQMANGWLRPGNLCIPLSKTGVGKTVFLSNVDYMLRSKRVLHITLENTQEELFELLRRIHRFHNPMHEDVHVESAFPLLGIADENRVTGEDIVELVGEYTEAVSGPPELVMLDYLGYFARTQRGGSEYEKTTAAVMTMKALAKKLRVPVITPHQAGRKIDDGESFKGDEARDSGAVEETADFEFGMYRPAEAVQTQRLSAGQASYEFNIQIMKSRRGGKGRIAQLALSPASLAIVDLNDRIAFHRVQQECAQYNQGLSYEEIASNARAVALHKAQGVLV